MSIVSAAAPQVPAASDPLAGLGIGRLLGAGVDNPSAQEVADIAPIPMGMARRVNMAKLQAALAKRSPLGFYRA
jgi:hypothetical protein